MPSIATFIEVLLDASSRKHKAEQEIRACASRLFATYFPVGSTHIDRTSMRLITVVGEAPSEKVGVVLRTSDGEEYTATEAHLFLRPVQNGVAL